MKNTVQKNFQPLYINKACYIKITFYQNIFLLLLEWISNFQEIMFDKPGKDGKYSHLNLMFSLKQQ